MMRENVMAIATSKLRPLEIDGKSHHHTEIKDGVGDGDGDGMTV